ncbi:MAG: hypothetical protein IJM83_04165, partial [Firmicutes bacterium]|nr:hypothetical protein [Bacillota bacterium]
PGIGKDNLENNLLAQSKLQRIAFSGEDTSQMFLLAQDLDKIARQIDAPPKNAKIYWVAGLENALSAPMSWGGLEKT